MVAGVIVAAAGDGATAQAAVASAAGPASPWVTWLVLGGPALFLAGHAAFKLAVWRRISWQRVGGAVVLAQLGLLEVSALVLSACAAGVVVAVIVADQVRGPPASDSPSPSEQAAG